MKNRMGFQKTYWSYSKQVIVLFIRKDLLMRYEVQKLSDTTGDLLIWKLDVRGENVM